jgi:hypothetical protein
MIGRKPVTTFACGLRRLGVKQPRAGIGDLAKNFLFLYAGHFCGLDKVRDKIGTTLHRAFDVSPFTFYALLLCGELVVTAAAQAEGRQKHDGQKNCFFHISSPHK